MSSSTISAGARYYGRLTLPLYDHAVLRTVVQYAWCCPLELEQELYNKSIGPRHLDVGVASGYFLHKARWPVEKPEIVLMDLNPNSTKYAAERLRRYNVTEVVGDALEPFPVTGKFDSVGMFHLLHCIPGDLKEKAVALKNAGKVLKPNGVVFGANVTPVDSQPNAFAKLVLGLSHRLGALNNQHDSHADMEEALDMTFHDFKLEKVGCLSLREGRNPKDD